MQKMKNARTLAGVYTHTHTDNLANNINKTSTQNKPIDL